MSILTEQSHVTFFRSKFSLPMTLPDSNATEKPLFKLLCRNVCAPEARLIIAWITYTIGHPKTEFAKYPILVLIGPQGSGKSWVLRLIMRLIDPNRIGVRAMPSTPKELAIATQNAHILAFDNLREISPSMSDTLCMVATKGAIAGRALYTDAEETEIKLHGAVMLNGIHPFISEPDLVQRCLIIDPVKIKDQNRKTESELLEELDAALPSIMHELLNLTAKILDALPKVTCTRTERMMDFMKWLAALEQVEGISYPVYQDLYSEYVTAGQMNILQENLLATALMEFIQNQPNKKWTGTPANLLQELNISANHQNYRDRDWPQNSIALAKRLKPLEHALSTQGIHLESTRGKERTITVTFSED